MKKRTFLRLLATALAVPLLALAAGCGPRKARANHLRVGVIAGAEERLAEAAVKVARERHGLEVELVVLSDYNIPNAALDQGDIDANAFQHRPFLDAQVRDRGYKIVAVGNTFVYPLAAYSKRIKSVSALADGATVAVPNDPTNLGRALLLLAREGLLALRPGAGIDATVLDIAANPKKLRIAELDAAHLPRALPDVDLAIINTTYASQIDLNPARDGLFVEGKDSPYVNLIVAREDNKDSPEVRNFVKAYQSDEVLAAAGRIFPGGFVQGW
ncbi:methionine ABC transporter substrate-binding lipoprotein MetQ [Termitidicoccus mucosus]|uniref:Lipoprotein n=1 Tax=Termitidicoccus mucosus TaxID=1184151 RepID=A0A178IFA6_9BACT|nr:DL-methionine transporter substrate-binding subunit [Opitutaceae bacterium TSB47]